VTRGLRAQYRWGIYKNIRQHVDDAEGGMDKFTSAYNHYGINRGEHEGKPGIWYREWAPGAQALALVGDFNSWEPKGDHWALKNDFGSFALFLPDVDGKPQIAHRCGAAMLACWCFHCAGCECARR
jgi:1,4-alpha-glucan branching enzyme